MIKEIRQKKECPTCHYTLEHREVEYYCDQCGKLITEERSAYINIVTIFWKKRDPGDENCSETTYFDFCSRECCRGWLLGYNYDWDKIHFINLPSPESAEDLAMVVGKGL